MIDLWDIRYVRLGTNDLDGATRYATQVVGLEAGAKEAGAQYFRSDSRDHTLVYFEATPRTIRWASSCATCRRWTRRRRTWSRSGPQ